MTIRVGDVFILKGRMGRVRDFEAGGYYDIPEGAKVTVLAIEGTKARIRFSVSRQAKGSWEQRRGVRLVDTDALYNATDVYAKSQDGTILLLERISAGRRTLDAARRTASKSADSFRKLDKAKYLKEGIKSSSAGFGELIRGIIGEFRK